MARLSRIKQKIFGSAAGFNQIGTFGSLAAGSPAYTTDPSTIQSLSNYLSGWYAAVVGNNSPVIQDMNAIHFLYARQLAYLMESGVPEWESATTYYVGNIVNVSGFLYVSLTDNNLNHAVTDGANWRILGGGFRTVSASVSATATDELIRVNNGATARTITLPAVASSKTGQRIIIKRLGSANVTVLPNGSEVIDGEASYVLTNAGDSATFFNNGVSWDTLNMAKNLAINVRDFGAIGDGVTDDTAAIQAAVATGRAVFFPKPAVNYLISASLTLKQAQLIYGETKSTETSVGIIANMSSPVFVLGDGITPTLRHFCFRDIRVLNSGGPVIMSRYATNWSAFDCSFSGGGGYNAVDMEQSYRIGFYNCDISTSGAGWAASLLDNSNVILFSNCAMTGGSSGGVCDAGRSYNITFDNCVFEATKYGLRFGTNPSATVGGECNGVVLTGCSWEQSTEPLRIGDHYACQAVVIDGCFFSNSNTSVIAPRTETIVLGRIVGLTITGCRFSPYVTEPIFNFKADPSFSSIATINNGVIQNNYFETVGGGYIFSGGFTASPSAMNLIPKGLYMEFGLANISADPTIIGEKYHFTTGIVSPATLANISFIVATGPTGAYIEKVELIRVDSVPDLSGTLEIGYSADIDGNLSVALPGGVTWIHTAFGYYADITSLLLSKFIPVSDYCLFRIDTPAGSGTIQMNVTYRK